MEYFSRSKYKGTHQPDFVASSVSAIDYEYLAKRGCKCVAYDIDGTLTRNKTHDIDNKLAEDIKVKLDKAGIKVRYIASNSRRSLDVIAGKLGAFEIHQPSGYKGKPSKLYYEQLITKTGLKPNEIVMIGDRLIQDIWGAKKSGLTTVLVSLNPEYATFRDKIIFRHLWQPIFVRKKIIK